MRLSEFPFEYHAQLPTWRTSLVTERFLGNGINEIVMLWVIGWCYEWYGDVMRKIWIFCEWYSLAAGMEMGKYFNGCFVSYNNDVEPGARQQSHLEKEEGRSVSEAFAGTKCSKADGRQLGTSIIRIPLQSAQGPTNQTMYIHHVCRAPARHRKP